MARYLVTGGAGFIGSHVAHAFLAAGHDVVVLDNFLSGKRENLEGLEGPLEIVEGSICVPADVERAMQGCAGVVHLAAVPSVARSVEAPVESHEANVTGTVIVLDVARRLGAKVVYAGSSSAYGDQDEVEAKHEELRESPLSPYASAKLAGELYCRSFAQVYELPIVVTRFFNVFGPRQVPDSPYSGVIAAFCFALLKGKAPQVHGDGLQSRDFTYVSDVAHGVLLAMTTETRGCQTVNIACGGNHSILDILAGLQKEAGTGFEPEFTAARSGDVRHSRADIRRAEELLGFTAEVSLDEGLAKTYSWYRSTY